METNRLILREYTIDDLNDLYQIIGDKETMVHYPKPYDIDGCKRWINWNLDNYQKYGHGLWAIILKKTGEFIGDCGITIQNIDGEKLPEIGYHINKKYWRQGYGKEAAAFVRDLGFEKHNYETLYSYMKSSNVASYSLAQSIGLIKIKEYEDDIHELTYVYALNKEDWQRLK